ncbi:MAG: polyphosphate glucokinase [Saprospiraceae bacterium]|jgi:polyphosphate glucokinase|tara:strand:+ start:468 stop:1214 length:747 start_codon:yes stop_codon:yes gene_type:complete
MEFLGIDIGGSGIKGAIVDTETGELVTERYRLPTPQPAKPESVAKVVNEIVNHFNWKGAIGCCFPTVVVDGQCRTISNLHEDWVGVQIDQLFSQHCNGLPFFVANDADLAGIAEMKLGVGKGKMGKVIMVTIGTGLGTGFFFNGQLIPNSELGHVRHTDGKPIEKYAADSARKKDGLKTKEWAERFDYFLHHIVRIFSPNFFIIGGGMSKKYEKFEHILTVNVPVEVAHFKNNAGIIGAAMYAEEKMK